MADLTPYIYHEKQDGLLCAQHCINSLLQASNFTAVDLANIAIELDNEENKMLRIRTNNSYNMDDTGYFSSQVIYKALKIFELDLINIDSEDPLAIKAKKFPSEQNAFICHFQHHWFAIRRFGYTNSNKQWYNLDSKLSAPKKLSNLYLDAFLSQLRIEGYTIFLVINFNRTNTGLSPCLADDMAETLI